MLNNITNFFNLIATKKVKTQLDATDLLAIGTKDPRFTGNYQPTLIKYSDLASQILAGPITVGVTSIASGAVGRLLFEGTGNVLEESANLFWDNTNSIFSVNGRLGIGTSSPAFRLEVQGGDVRFANGVTIGTAGSAGWQFSSNTVTLIQNGFLGVDVANGRTFGITNTAFSTFYFRIAEITGNIGINTTTDAGFRLDVNGTARVQGNTTVTGTIAIGSSSTLNLTGAINSNLIQGTQTIEYRSGGSSINRAFHYFTNSLTFNPTVDFIPHVTMAATFGPTSGTGTYAQLVLQPTINQTGGANGITRGLYINPTLTSAFDFRAIEVASGGAYINTTSVNASAILQADSTTKGFLPPRMTSVQRTAIVTPATGLMVYQTDGTEGLYIYKSTGWVLNS